MKLMIVRCVIPVVRLNYTVRLYLFKKHNYKLWLNYGVY